MKDTRGPYRILNRRKEETLDRVPITAERTPLIDRKTRVLAIGSCFAMELTKALVRKEWNVYDWPQWRNNLVMFHTWSIRYEMERAAGTFHQARDDRWILSGGNRQDPYRRLLVRKTSRELRLEVKRINAALGDAIRNAECIIITLGMTEAWELPGGNFICAWPGYRYPRLTPHKTGGHGAELRVLDYDDNFTNMCCALNALREVNRKCRVIITVSPVLSFMTFQDADHLVANTESKSVLRAVAGALVRQFDRVHYFHSYEMAMFTDRNEVVVQDGRHVRSEFATRVIEEFEKVFCEDVAA